MAWSFLPFVYSLINVLFLYFVIVSIKGKDILMKSKILLLALTLPILLVTPTKLNLGGFNLNLCGAAGFEGQFPIYYKLFLSILVFISILFIFTNYWKRSSGEDRKKNTLLIIGSQLFLISFFLTEFLASYLIEKGIVQDYSITQYGFLAMSFFIGFLVYSIVKFKTFNIKLLATQALVWVLVALIGSQFFFIKILINFVLNGITFVGIIVFGHFLVQSVKAEVRQREIIEKQEKELEIVNAQQETLLHFISHEVKGYLTEGEAGFASIVEGDYGTVPDQLRTMASSALSSVRKGVATIMDILDASNLKKGTVSYARKPFNLSQAIEDVVHQLKPAAEEKGLKLSYHKPITGPCMIEGDEEKIRQNVIRNVIDNSIHYTPHGEVRVELIRMPALLRIIVTDTGVGITPEDMRMLFTEGGHGKDSIKVNVHSTGYGLYIAKQITEAHGGKIWAESDGDGKGSRFIVEFPV